MLLAIDVGNTNTVFALHDGTEVIAEWRCSTDRQRTADEELRRARAESAAIIAEARQEADDLRAQARRIVEEARAEVAALARQRESITEELGQLSGVIQALAVPTPTHPSTTQEPDQ